MLWAGMVWAEMVMGRNGHGPKWLWAEMTSDRVSYSWINNVTTLILPTLILPVNDLGVPIYWRDLRSTETERGTAG